MIDIKEIKHFIGTNLNVFTDLGTTTLEIALFNPMIGAFKPIVRPITDLGKVIEHNGERFTPIKELITEVLKAEPQRIKVICDNYKISAFWGEYSLSENYLEYDFAFKTFNLFIGENISFLPIEVYQKLPEWGFDIFGWIEKDLAINYNEFHKKK